MSELASADAVIAVHPDDERRFALLHRVGDLSPSFIDRLHTREPTDLRLYGRSVLGQMGINIKPDGEPIIQGKGRGRTVYSPVDIAAYSPVGECVLADLDEMRERRSPGTTLRAGKRGKTIEGGRYVDFGQLRRLEKEETQAAFQQLLLAADVRHPSSERLLRINDDGSITMPVALVETLMSDYTLGTRDERLNAIKHGRAGLKPHIDTVERRLDDPLPSFLVGGIALSPGPFTCVIRENLDRKGRVTQLSSAAMVDGNRLMGIGRDLELYTGHRQIEIHNQTATQTFADTYVTIDVYRDTNNIENLHPIVDWYGMSRERRGRLHQVGVSPLDVIHVANPSARERLARAYKGTAGILMSSHGAEQIPAAATDKLTADHVETVAKSFGRNRPVLESVQPFVDALAPAGDRSRVFVGERLLAEYMPRLAEAGDVQSFFVEDYGDEAMSQQVHSRMVDLVRSGVSIGWDNEGEMRIFHRSGLWIAPEDVNRIERLDMVIAMYGTHRQAVDRELEPKIEEFFQQLTTLMPVRYLAVTHGNGPGVMRMSDVLGRAAGMMSLGVGIEVEGQEEGKDIWLPNGTAYFKNSERLYRQQRMDKLRIVSIINPGGDGTIEEAGINVCTNKLNSAIPSPTIVVDPPGDYYDHLVAQFAMASNRKEIDIFGKKVDISGTPFAQPWVTNTIHHVRHYGGDYGAYAVIENFWKDPAAYWERAGVPKHEVARAYRCHSQDLGHMGMRLADRFVQAVNEYTA